MNSREKFINVLEFNTSSPVPNWEFGYWYDTIQRWYKEGLPKKNPLPMGFAVQFMGAEAFGPGIADLHEYFGFDEGIGEYGYDLGPVPAFTEEVYEEDEEYIIYRRQDGKKVRTIKDGSSMPNFLEYPVKTEEDFEAVKKRFQPDTPRRYPDNFEQIMHMHQSRSYPLQLGAGNFCGFYSILRELLGVEESFYIFYDNPDFAIRILDHFLNYYIGLYTRILAKTDIDYLLIWEDMAFKNGPLLSPELFKEFILPYYKKLTASMRQQGVKHFIVDTDGNFEVLIPLFIEGGVTGFYPFEVSAGMDIEKVREEYPRLVIMGGIDKMALASGKEAIDREISKVERMLGKGGYLPYTDHAVPPDVSFQNYSYFRKRMKEVLGNR